MFVKKYNDIEVTYDSELDAKKKGCIYLLIFPNNKVYIGQTTNTISRRITGHCSNKSSCRKLKNAIQKHSQFRVMVLSSNLSLEQLNAYEVFFIKAYDSIGTSGYNLQGGGNAKECSDETRAILKKVMTGKKYNVSTEGRERSRENLKNVSTEGRERSRLSKIGKPLTAEHCIKISESNIGKKNKMVKSVQDGIIFESIAVCEKYYNITKGHLQRYYNGKIHAKSGQTFVLV